MRLLDKTPGLSHVENEFIFRCSINYKVTSEQVFYSIVDMLSH